MPSGAEVCTVLFSKRRISVRRISVNIVDLVKSFQGWLQKERGQRGGARTPQKGLFRRSGDTETEEGESSTQKESEARVIPVA